MAKESDKSYHHQQRDEKISPWKKTQRWEQQ